MVVECHAPLSLLAMIGLLPRLPLSEYDLIVLHPGHCELQRPVSLQTLWSIKPCPLDPKTRRESAGTSRFRAINQINDALTLSGLRLLTLLTGLPRLKETRSALRTVLDNLQPYGHNVVLVTPFPHQEPISNWLRQQGRQVFREEGYRAFMPVFDAYPLLNLGDICFSPNAPDQLNALGHELIGSVLYDFFREGVVIAGNSSSYRRHD